MAVPKDKTRLTITIHKETKQLMDELLSLHNIMGAQSNVQLLLQIMTFTNIKYSVRIFILLNSNVFVEFWKWF